MLFLHHNEAIGLYHIPMARSGDKGMFINGQPRIQQVTDEFKWAQWDSQHQCLYVVCPKQKTSDKTVDDDEDVNPDLMFAAYQFKERSSYVRVLYLPIPFLDVELLSKTSIPEYLDANAALTQTVSEKHINMHVVSLPGKGSFYVCLQLLVLGQASETQSSLGNAAEQFSQLEYSVYVLHHGCLMNCVLPTVRPRREDLENYRIFFSSLNDYVMVFLPGHFMHLLNCNPERQPCHHIILQGDAVPKFPSSKASFCEPRLLLYLNKEISTSLQTGPYIYDCSTNAAYKYSFNKAALAELFAKTHMPSTRLAILHLAVIHLRDSGLIKKIFEHLSHDPASPECLDLLREYLVGSTYGTLRRELEKEVVTLIPFTCVDTYRGHLEKDMHRKRIAQMSCSFVKDIPIEFKNVKGKMKHLDFWTALLHNTKKLPPRFKLQTPGVDIFDYDNDSDEEMDAAPESSLVRSLYRRLSVTRRLSHHGSSESVTSQASGKSRGSVDSPAEKKSVHEAKKENAIINRLASHLQNHLPREAKVKIHNIAIEYVKCQARQSEQLIRLFNQALEFANNPFTLPLSLRGTLREVVFFQLVERFCTAAAGSGNLGDLVDSLALIVMVVGDAPVPPCTPCYQPLDAPELDREVSRFALPPAMTPEPSDDLGFYNFSWEAPVHLHATNNEITEGKGKIGSLLFKAVMTLINEGQKVKDSEVGLPKEQPQRPHLQPSNPPFTPEEIPEFHLPQAQGKDFDVFTDLDMVRQRLSQAQAETVADSNQVVKIVKTEQTILEMLSNHQDQKIMSLSPYLEKSEEQRRRTSTCSTCVTLAEAPSLLPRPKLSEAPNPHGITGRA